MEGRRGSGRWTFSVVLACSACSRSTSSSSRSPASPAGTRQPMVTSGPQLVGVARHGLLADGKFITIFAMLLGVSIVMMAERRWRAGHPGLAYPHEANDGSPGPGRPARLPSLVRRHARSSRPERRRGLFRPATFARGALVLGGLAFAAGSVLSFTLTWSTAQSDPAARWPRGGRNGRRAPRSSISRSPSTGGVARADGAARAGGAGDGDGRLRHPALLADDGADADGHGLLQARGPQRRPLAGLLSAHGGPRVQRRHRC